MQRHFEALGIPWNRVTALRKLACQGNRKMGALSFLPSGDEMDFNNGLVVELGKMVDAARKALRRETGEIFAPLSPGGAQPKALLAMRNTT